MKDSIAEASASALDQRHAALMAAVSKHANKVSPLLIACGLIQEGVNLTQSLAEHCQALKKENHALSHPDEPTPIIEHCP